MPMAKMTKESFGMQRNDFCRGLHIKENGYITPMTFADGLFKLRQKKVSGSTE